MRQLTTCLLFLLAGCGIVEPQSKLTISGTVRTPNGGGIQGAGVLGRFDLPYGSGQSTTTDATGNFRMDMDPPPGYGSPGSSSALYLDAWAPGYDRASEAITVVAGTSLRGIEIVLNPYGALTITTSSLPPAIPTVAYDELLDAEGGHGPYTWSLSDGSLPPGLTLDSLDGDIRGSTTTSGSWVFSVRVADGSGNSAERQLSLTVVDGVVLKPTELCSDYSPTAIPTFEDERLREAVRAAAGVAADEPLTCGLLASLTRLDASAPEGGGDNYVSLVGIQNLANLTVLLMRGEYLLTDISPLSALTKLVELDLSGVGASDISVLGGLTNLQSLDLEDVQIRDLSLLAGLTNLTSLNLGSDDVTDLGPLSSLPSLKSLSIDYTNLSDLSPLSAIDSLAELSLEFDEVTDLSPLGQISGLKKVDLRGNFVSDISALGAHLGLTDLNLAQNPIRDLSALSGLAALKTLVLFSDSISDISPLSGLTELSYLDLSENDIGDISAVSDLTSLDTLNLGDNSIVDVSAIERLVNLALLNLGGNAGLSDIQAILDNMGIGAGDWVDLEETAVSCADVYALHARGVIAFAPKCY